MSDEAVKLHPSGPRSGHVQKLRERRVPIMFSEAELQAIDDWRFAKRIATRAGAVRELCARALISQAEGEGKHG